MKLFKKPLLWIAGKTAFLSGCHLVPLSKPVEWTEEATTCEERAALAEIEGNYYRAGFLSGRAHELVKISNSISND